jgi:hypothetical protein
MIGASILAEAEGAARGRLSVPGVFVIYSAAVIRIGRGRSFVTAMQNQGAPQGGTFGGPSQPPARKGLSKGCIIGIIAALVVAVGGVILLIAIGIGGYYFYGREGSTTDNTTYNSSARGVNASARGGRSTAPAGDAAEAPNPTSAQMSAVAGGQTAEWSQQEISWTVPQRWSEQEVSSEQFFWRSPGTWDAANLIVSITPMAADFPMETANNATYEQAQTRKANGEVSEVRWLRLDGIKGVMFRESAPEDEDGDQRLQWISYRNYKGQVQYINIMLATRGKDFPRHEDTLYGILYTTDFTP